MRCAASTALVLLGQQVLVWISIDAKQHPKLEVSKAVMTMYTISVYVP